jgi:hypothetical protein
MASEKHYQQLLEILKIDGNHLCADCESKGWKNTNLKKRMIMIMIMYDYDYFDDDDHSRVVIDVLMITILYDCDCDSFYLLNLIETFSHHPKHNHNDK